ncbi:MAG: YezD family protein [Planctomycetes bacterium]|nr:YezD family protein [Planctomycetota bacterium]
MPGKEGESEIVQGDLGRHIAKALRGLRFGSIEIVVHDGRVVQIERKEKLRLEKDRQGKDARE